MLGFVKSGMKCYSSCGADAATVTRGAARIKRAFVSQKRSRLNLTNQSTEHPSISTKIDFDTKYWRIDL